MAFAWMPKATVQAALGGVVLGIANDADLGDDFVLAGERIVILAFFSIVLTAPPGAVLTAFFGTKLLTKGEAPEEQLPETEWGRRAYGGGRGLSQHQLTGVVEKLKTLNNSLRMSDGVTRGVSQFERSDIEKAMADL